MSDDECLQKMPGKGQKGRQSEVIPDVMPLPLRQPRWISQLKQLSEFTCEGNVAAQKKKIISNVRNLYREYRACACSMRLRCFWHLLIEVRQVTFLYKEALSLEN